MKALLEKLQGIERTIYDEKGGFVLFALLLRRDAIDRWDLVAAAHWIDANRKAAIEYLAEKLNGSLSPEEIVRIDRIVALSVDNPAILGLQRDLHAQGLKNGHGIATLGRRDAEVQEIRNVDFSNQEIHTGFVFALNSEKRNVELPLIPNSAT